MYAPLLQQERKPLRFLSCFEAGTKAIYPYFGHGFASLYTKQVISVVIILYSHTLCILLYTLLNEHLGEM